MEFFCSIYRRSYIFDCSTDSFHVTHRVPSMERTHGSTFQPLRYQSGCCEQVNFFFVLTRAPDANLFFVVVLWLLLNLQPSMLKGLTGKL
ncbi:hypothetical protein Ae201684P_014561 [Aphanomyces euteiches]|uniref:Uncharacterized protein n=1 Tax=Aphanomyces euteiches TaxID=100861 RepID=A0A6G0W7Z7_9STRA|nr:hypothetical protein Ae201684_017729 [Aphanomyces euteiches]KAH9095495.1 hypothetical protein Ae201684P_014561 [Aphanomyces euteiches]